MSFAKLLLICLSAGLGSQAYAHGGGLDANFVGPRGGTYTFTKNGKKNYAGC